MKTFIKVFIVMIMILGIGAVSSNAQLLFFGNPLVGKTAPDFTLESLDGKQVNITELRNGRNAIYFFWATWCPHCRNAIVEINKNLQTFKDKGILVVLINEGEGEGVVSAFVKKNNLDIPILLDKKTKLSDSYNLVGLPTFFYVK